MEFCRCGSIIMNGGCTNRKCSGYKKTAATEHTTFKQLEYLRDLVEQLGRDESEYDLESITSKEASQLINELEEELEAGDI